MSCESSGKHCPVPALGEVSNGCEVNSKAPRVLCCGETSNLSDRQCCPASVRGSVDVPAVQASTAFAFGPCFQPARVVPFFLAVPWLMSVLHLPVHASDLFTLHREGDGAIEFCKIKFHLRNHHSQIHNWSDDRWKACLAAGAKKKKPPCTHRERHQRYPASVTSVIQRIDKSTVVAELLVLQPCFCQSLRDGIFLEAEWIFERN